MTFTDKDMKDFWRRLFFETNEDAEQAVNLLRRCLQGAILKEDVCRDVSQFVAAWDGTQQKADESASEVMWRLPETTPADKQWCLSRIEEEIKAGRAQNAISYVSFAIAEAEASMRRKCQYLLDVLDDQGFEERDLSEEDEDAIKGIRAAIAKATGTP